MVVIILCTYIAVMHNSIGSSHIHCCCSHCAETGIFCGLWCLQCLRLYTELRFSVELSEEANQVLFSDSVHKSTLRLRSVSCYRLELCVGHALVLVAGIDTAFEV